MASLSQHRYRPPISIKGVVIQANKVALVKNDRNEWELPGGRLERHESPEECVRREISEELGINATVRTILDTWVYEVYENAAVFIVTYGCLADPAETLTLSDEHRDLGLFSLEEIEGLIMPEGYKRSIRHWFTKLNTPQN